MIQVSLNAHSLCVVVISTVMFVELRLLTVIFFVILNVQPSCAGETKPAAPQNVKITSINMGAVLEWKYPHNDMDNVTYTTRYILKKDITYSCINSKELKCDVGELPSIFGIYRFQVRAECQGHFSDWVSASDFIPIKHTTLGPATVHLVIRSGMLDVHVQDPVLKVGKLADFQTFYIIKIWIDGFEESVIEKKMNKEENEEDVKMSIKASHFWSRYCAQVRVVSKGFRHDSPFSKAVCVLNIHVLSSCGIAAAVLLPLVILTSWMIYKVNKFLYPETELPDRFSKFETIQHTTNQKEQLDKISSISEDHLHEGPSVKAENLEDTCCLAPIQEVEDDYKQLMQTEPAPAFYPNHLYPLCLKNNLLPHLNQPAFGGSIAIQSNYYNLADKNSVF